MSDLVSTIPLMGPPTVLTEKPFQVARVQAPGGPEGAPDAFMRLEERMESLRGSRMYGLLYPGEPTAYYACLRLDDDHSDDLGFDREKCRAGSTGGGWSEIGRMRFLSSLRSSISFKQIYSRLALYAMSLAHRWS